MGRLVKLGIVGMVLVIVVVFAGILSISPSQQISPAAVKVDGIFNIADFPPVITAVDFIGDAGDLVIISASAYDPNGNTTTLYYSAPLNASGQWQSTAIDSGIFYANITATDGLQISLKTVAIKLRPYCGDGNLTPPEQCDDGNNLDGDGCSASCVIEPSPLPPAGGGGGGGGAVRPAVPEVPEVPIAPPVPRPEIPVLPPAPRPPVQPAPEPIVPIPAEVPGALPIQELISSYRFGVGETTKITAVDNQGNPLPDAGVRVTLPDGSQRFYKTGPDGIADVSFDQPGEYDILLYKAGYQSKRFRVAVASLPVEEAPMPLPVVVLAAGGIALAVAAIVLVFFLELFVVWKLRKKVFKDHVRHEIMISNISRVLRRKAHDVFIIVRTMDRLSDVTVDNYRDVHVKHSKEGDKTVYSFVSHKKPFHLAAGQHLLVSFKVHGKEEPRIRVRHSSWLPWSRHAGRVKDKKSE